MMKNKPQTAGRKPKTAAAKTRKIEAKAAVKGDNPLLAPWQTPFEMPPFDRIGIEHFVPAFDRGFAVNRKEIAAIAGSKAAPTFANTIDALEQGRRRPRPHLDRVLQPCRHRHQRGHPGHRAGAGAALCQARHAHLPGRDAVCPRRCPLQEAQEAQIERGAEPCARALPPRLRQVRCRPRAQRQEADGGDRPAHVRARHPLQPEPAGRRAGVRDGAGERVRPRRPARGRARGGGADGQGPRPPRQARHHVGALQRRAVPAVFGPARSAREGVQGLDHARRQRRQDRQPQDRSRDPGAAGRAGAAARLQDGGRLRARVLHGQDTRGRAQAADGGVEPGAGARGRGARSAAGGGAGRGRQLQARAMGLALLRREGAQSQVRRRRRRDQALPAARQRHRRGLRRRGQAVRRHHHGAQGPARLSPGGAGLRGQARRPPRRPVPRRLLRQAVEALGRLDVGLAQAGEARRRHPSRSWSTS